MIEMGDKIENIGWNEPVKDTTKKSIYIKYETMDDISIEIRIYKPHDKKYTAGSVTYEREMDSKENMLHVNHYYYNLFETDNRTQGSSHSINDDESCYYRPEKKMKQTVA